RDGADPFQALLLERRVAHRQDLVDEQDLGVEVGGDGEGQPNIHAAGVALGGGVEEFLDLGESDDVVELAVDLAARHAANGAVEVDILPAGQLLVKARPDLEQADNAAAQLGAAGGRLDDAAEDLEQRRFAGAVAADQADHLAGLDLEADVLQGPVRAALRVG